LQNIHVEHKRDGCITSCVTMLCQLQQLFSFELCERVIMFSEPERSWVEEVMACFEVIS
jgi:hypothetical protein